jgi:hypothetical protein
MDSPAASSAFVRWKQGPRANRAEVSSSLLSTSPIATRRCWRPTSNASYGFGYDDLCRRMLATTQLCSATGQSPAPSSSVGWPS